MTVTKMELANILFDELGLNKREAKEFVELFFELVAHRDIEEEDRAVADLLVEGAGFLRRAEGGVGEDALGEDHFAEGRGRLGEGHRVEMGVGAEVAHNIAVEGVADLVGQGADIAEGVVVGHIDAGFAG